MLVFYRFQQKLIKRDLCINRSNHQKPTFHPLGDFLNPALVLARTRFKEIANWAKIGFCQSSLFIQRFLKVFVKQDFYFSLSPTK